MYVCNVYRYCMYLCKYVMYVYVGNVCNLCIKFMYILYVCNVWVCMYMRACMCAYIYRVPQEECAKLRESVPYVKVYRYNPKHLCPNLNGYRDNGQRKVWSSGGSTHCTCQLKNLSRSVLEYGAILRQFSSRSL